MSRSLTVLDRFAPEARPLRAVFDDRLADPRPDHEARFVRDFWHVPGEDTLLRTPAWRYFPKHVSEAFHRRLVWRGRRRRQPEDLGFVRISAPQPPPAGSRAGH